MTRRPLQTPDALDCISRTSIMTVDGANLVASCVASSLPTTPSDIDDLELMQALILGDYSRSDVHPRSLLSSSIRTCKGPGILTLPTQKWHPARRSQVVLARETYQTRHRSHQWDWYSLGGVTTSTTMLASTRSYGRLDSISAQLHGEGRPHPSG